jgi:ATP-binding cassette subfamily F protein 3
MIRRQPNLLLLDEPTNHLDLDMRQALSRALVEFAGAIVLISHDRHLLRSVCDELLVVHDGVVDVFDRELDEYPAWLAERQAESAVGPRLEGPEVTAPSNRKRQRQLEAQRRLTLKPLADRVREVERRLAAGRAELESLQARLAEPALYTDTGRTDEITGLLREQATFKSSLAALESEWLEASDALERAVANTSD